MARWCIGMAAFLILFSSTATVQAADPIQVPGVTWAIFDPVTPKESERIIHSRPVPAGLNRPLQIDPDSGKILGIARAAAGPIGPNSIPELARALRNDGDLIYEYVRNNIEYYPIWGMQKATSAILDNQGTAFDQASLMTLLLRESGYTVSYILGGISLNATQVGEWLSVDTGNVCAVGQLLANGQIPFTNLQGVTAYTCPGTPVALASVKLSHIWLKVNIAGNNYYFDPSYKPHTFKAGINLATASGYNAATYLTQAKSGATITADYVQGMNRTNIRNNLTSYATTLTSYLRTNYPAGVLEDIVGGKTIIPYTGAPLRQTSLPYQDNSVPLEEWDPYIPDEYKPWVTISYEGITNQSFQSPLIYGKRLTITYNVSNRPVLMLDGVVVATGNPVTPGTVSDIHFTITHIGTNGDQAFSQKLKAGGTYVISNSWGPAGRGPIDQYRKQLDEARAAGSADTSEVVMGSSLGVLASSWIAQSDTVGYIIDRMATTSTLFHHRVGIAGYNGSSYVDLPANMISVTSQSNDTAIARTAFYSNTMHLSIFESTAVQQTSGVKAVSTVKLVDIASTNNDRIYNATSSNYSTGSNIQNSLVACSSTQKAEFQGYISAGYRLILPGHCDLNEDSWTGIGYLAINSTGTGIGGIISGNLAGGFSSSPQLPAPYVFNTYQNSWSPPLLKWSSGMAYGDPIDMVKGNYLYNSDDMKVGVGSYPHALTFQKIYSSGARTQAGPLGKGWSHNLASSVFVSSDGFQGMGADSALDAATTLVELMISLDLLTDTAKPLDKLVIATLGQRWFGDQLLDNTVIVRQGLNGEVFVKLPDATYNAPPANSAKLIKNGDGTYTYETVNRDSFNFNSAGKLATYNHASGVQVKFTYTGSDLTQVQNSLGRTLTLTNTSGRVTAVGDGSRSIDYAYDGSGNLSTFTDAAGKSTTFQYDLPGRMTKLFYPANPTLAFVTNVYDTLGRVKTQTNVYSYLYTYYFAGSRSEEVGPYSISNVSYIDGAGKVFKSINPLGKVTNNTYDGQTRLLKTTLPEGNSVEYTYDDATCASAEKRCTQNIATLSRVAKPGSGLADLVTSMTYESVFNKVATVTDPKGLVSSFTYTAQGNPLTVTRPADALGVQPVSTYAYVSYTPSGYPTFYLPSSVTEKTSATNSVVTATTYNASNKYVPQTVTVDSGTGKLNLVTNLTYNVIGDRTIIDGPRTDVSDITTIAYDNQRRPIQVTDVLGKLTKYAYDADGNPIRSSTQIGSLWMVSCNTYTASGKVLKAWGPAQTAADTTCPTTAAPVTVTGYSYTVFDTPYQITENLPTGEGGNRITEYSNLLDGSLYTISSAVGAGLAQTTATYTYTDNGLRASVKDAKNNLTTYQYDGHDRLAKTLYPDKTTPGVSSATDYEQLGYDANSNVTSLRGRNGQSTTLAYDNLNRLVGRSYPTTADNVAFSYDLLNRRTASSFADSSHAIAYTWDNAGRLASAAMTDATIGTKTLSYQYDAASNRTRITWPEATPFYVTTSYDALNRPTVIKELGTTNLATYAYDDLSRRTTVTLGNGAVTTYGYTTQSALASIDHNLTGSSQDNTWTYTRNQAQEIVTQAFSNNAHQWTGYANGTVGYTSNGLNQYTGAGSATPTYDTNGNLTGEGTWTYGYDQDNRLRTASKTGVSATLRYDPEGRLRQTDISSSIRNLLYDGTDLVTMYNATGNVMHRYVFGPGIDEPIVWYEGPVTGTKTWLFADHLGSIVALDGSSTGIKTYGPYGEPLPAFAASGDRFRYTGQQMVSELGLYYYKARFYSPTLGRFLQTDPVGYQSDLNLYAYVENNPINRTDPPGLFFLQVAGGGVNMAVGAIVSFSTGQDITLLNLGTDFAVGFVSSGAAGLGKLGTLANTGFGKAITAGGGEVVKGIGDEQRTPGQITGLAVGAAALNATGVIGKTGAALAQKSGLTISSNPVANELLKTGFGAPAAVGAGVALETVVKNGISSANAASMSGQQATQSTSLGVGMAASPVSQGSSIRARK